MNPEKKKRLEEIRWLLERKQKLSEFTEKTSRILSGEELKFLTVEDSNKFQIQTEQWPRDDKWVKGLYIQTKLSNSEKISKSLSTYLNLIPSDYVYVLFINYNFGLTQILKDKVLENWKALIELDGDEIYCYNPNDKYFICIEKTEDFLVGHEEKSRDWIYEMTFSNEELMLKIKAGI